MENQKTNSETQLTTDIKDMSLLVNKPYIAYVFKKTQKIAQALYLITDYFEPAEPLKDSMRKNANQLLMAGGSFLRNDQKDTILVAKGLIGSLLETIGFIDTAFLIHLISEKNQAILKDEITHMIQEIESNKEKKIQLSKEFIATPSIEEYKRQDVLYKGQNSVLEIKDMETNAIQKDISMRKAPSAPKPLQEHKAHRSVQIISLFKPGTELTIKDITTHLKEVSEKTVQRELLSLVGRGILKKKGERRWSRYSLI